MKAGHILKLAGQNYIDKLPERQRPNAIEVLNLLHSAADTFNADLSAAHADTKLSPEGLAQAGTRIAAVALRSLVAVEANIKKLTERATSLEQSLRNRATYAPPTNPAERIAHEQQLREIRDQLRELPAAERLQVYRSSTDPLVLAAIETAPMVLSEKRPDGSRRLERFIDPEEQGAALLARGETADPASAATLREVNALAEVYRLAVGSVRAEILKEVPGAAPKVPLTVLAS